MDVTTRSRWLHRHGRVALAVALAIVLPVLILAPVLASPASGPGAVSQTAPGALASGTVPDGTCRAQVTGLGGGGASSPVTSGLGGRGGSGASIGATYVVLPGQTFGGSVGGGGTVPNGGTGDGAIGTGGAAGTIVSNHRGGGGGGRSVVTLAGTDVVVAGGGGGGGAAHQAGPSGNGGGGGFAGIGAGVAAPGITGQSGVDAPGTANGGQGGQAAAGGAGGVNTASAGQNGTAGGGVGTGTGGIGGPDPNFDSAGGGGGGYTGGGGGASTVTESVTGSGGGGGSSWVAGTSPDALGTAATGVGGAAGPASPVNAGSGSNGSVSIDWLPCTYSLSITKSVSPTQVPAGTAAIWTVSITNTGPDPMTRGDTVDLSDTLPPGPNGSPAPAYEVTSFSVTGGTNLGMSRGAVTCAGVVVGSSMPASTTCSRTYDAPGATQSPTGGQRGIDPGETITITYEQIVANTAPCQTITNTATTTDRASTTGTTDVVGVAASRTADASLTIDCYDLAVDKAASPATAGRGDTVTWTISVTNSAAASMEGPDDTTSNPLVVTDAFPTTGMESAAVSSSVGPAGSCSLSGGLITCADGLPAGSTHVITVTQVVSASAVDESVVTNAASVSDPTTGDTNDADSAQVTILVNDPPVANDDSTVTDEETPVDIDVLVNDTDLDGDTLTVISHTQASNGTVTCTATQCTYTPDPDFTGIDTFTYTISDGNGGTDTATVTVDVGSVNDVPSATDDSAETEEGTPVDIDVLDNDGDVDGELDPTSVAITSLPANGTVTVDPVTGLVTYTPDPGFTGVDTFDYQVCDDLGACVSATVTVTVTAQDEASIPDTSASAAADRHPNGLPALGGLLLVAIAAFWRVRSGAQAMALRGER